MSSVGSFVVYAGSGVFVEKIVEGVTRNGVLSVSKSLAVTVSDKPSVFERSEAVRACRVARAAGVRSWLVSASVLGVPA